MFIFILRLLSTTIIVIIVSIVVLIANLIYYYIEYNIAYIKWEKKPNLNIYILNKSNLLFISIENASI